MTVTLLRVETDEASADSAGHRRIRVCVEIDGAAEWHEVHVQADWLPQTGAGLIEAGNSLRDRLGSEPNALYRVCKLAARAMRGRALSLPASVCA